jgi:predicted O-methyltransferase YrrM
VRNFETSDYLEAISHDRYQVILIDGQDWTWNERPVCFKRAERNIEAGGIVIVDDAWRRTYNDLLSSNVAKKAITYQSTGPFRFGVTRTDIYFY